MRNHALVDGNKRLGWLATVVFYGLNDVTLDAPDDDAYEFVMASPAANPRWRTSLPHSARGPITHHIRGTASDATDVGGEEVHGVPVEVASGAVVVRRWSKRSLCSGGLQ